MSPQTIDFNPSMTDLKWQSIFMNSELKVKSRVCVFLHVIVGHGLRATDYKLYVFKRYKGSVLYASFFAKQNIHDIVYISIPVPELVHEVQGTALPRQTIHDSPHMDWQKTSLLHIQTAAWNITNFFVTSGTL